MQNIFPVSQGGGGASPGPGGHQGCAGPRQGQRVNRVLRVSRGEVLGIISKLKANELN